MPVIVLLYIIQMVFMKILLKDAWICTLLGNTLYMTAIVYYCYITFLGYNGKKILCDLINAASFKIGLWLKQISDQETKTITAVTFIIDDR